MNPFMHDPSFGCGPIFIPNLLDMNQGALPLAKDIVLEGRDHDEIFFINFIGLMCHI
jgi:hypothetical protein